MYLLVAATCIVLNGTELGNQVWCVFLHSVSISEEPGIMDTRPCAQSAVLLKLGCNNSPAPVILAVSLHFPN